MKIKESLIQIIRLYSSILVLAIITTLFFGCTYEQNTFQDLRRHLADFYHMTDSTLRISPEDIDGYWKGYFDDPIWGRAEIELLASPISSNEFAGSIKMTIDNPTTGKSIFKGEIAGSCRNNKVYMYSIIVIGSITDTMKFDCYYMKLKNQRLHKSAIFGACLVTGGHVGGSIMLLQPVNN